MNRQKKTFEEHFQEEMCEDLLEDFQDVLVCALCCSIMDAFKVSEGRILPGSGLAEFIVEYRAVVWRPFKGEVVS